MVAQEALPVEDRIVELLRGLGIGKAHAAAYLPGDWSGLLERHPSAVASLTLICPRGMKTDVLRVHARRLLIVSGDGGNVVGDLMRAVDGLPGATVKMLRDYFSPMWADVMADRTGEVESAMLEFLALRESESPASSVQLPEGEGEEAGISYTVRGSGPPLLLFPLGLAPSQWDPLLPALRRTLHHHHPGRRVSGHGGVPGNSRPRLPPGGSQRGGRGRAPARPDGAGGGLRRRHGGALAGPLHRAAQSHRGGRHQRLPSSRGRETGCRAKGSTASSNGRAPTARSCRSPTGGSTPPWRSPSWRKGTPTRC